MEHKGSGSLTAYFERWPENNARLRLGVVLSICE